LAGTIYGTVRVERVRDHREYRGRVEPLLLGDETRHNLMLGLCTTLVEHPGVYREFYLWLVEDGRSVVGAAILTPPFNVAVARPAAEGALPALARAIAEDGTPVPGVSAAVPEVDGFVAHWRDVTGAAARVRMASRIYRLTTVTSVAGVPGRLRAAAPEDRYLLVQWIREFNADVYPEDPPHIEPERVVDLRLQGQGGGFFLWEDVGRPVCLVGYGGFTPHGARIGPVYTPRELRRRGYASALTAGVSAWLLDQGRQFCFLYTDLANPTSNRIYQQIGYEPICDSAQYAFEPSDS